MEEILIEKKLIENVLKPLLVGELLKQKELKPMYSFHIPSYQRGYRWGHDEVLDLLEDLFEFVNQTEQEKYCLQPIVVKRMINNTFEVLDGQQRLTTIFILLKGIKKYLPLTDSFNIQYQTRSSSENFLKNLSETDDENSHDNPDYYYISSAYKLICKWLSEKHENHQDTPYQIFSALVKRIEFIWYEIKEETDAIEVFTRINIGKIPLTNAELVKAVFLSKNNLSIGYSKEDRSLLNLKQVTIATEWDNVQTKLQNTKFWNFIYNGRKEYETRIDYILELICNSKDEKNGYATFRMFYEKIKESKSDIVLLKQLKENNSSLIELEWQKIKFIIDILQEWYEDHYYYHYLGFLINQGVSIDYLKAEYLRLNRDEFTKLIDDEARKLINATNINVLNYNNHYKQIDRILLLYNIISTYNMGDENNWFPFNLYQSDTRSLEHIYAQNSEDVKIDNFENWLIDNIESLKSDEDSKAVLLVKAMQKLLNRIEDVKKETQDFLDVFKKVGIYYQEKIEQIDLKHGMEIEGPEDEIEYNCLFDVHSIANLALLDSSSNSSLSNSLFDVKRRKIIDKDRKGTYIPIETKRVFLKYHTDYPSHLGFWTLDDKKSYLHNIRTVLSKYIK